MKGVELIGQNFKNKSGVKLRFIDMPRSQSPVLIVFDQMVIGVARESKRVQPQRIDRCLYDLGQFWSDSDQVLHIVVQEIVANRMRDVGDSIFQTVEVFLQ